MSGCLDEMHCPDFEAITERRNLISSISAGGLVSYDLNAEYSNSSFILPSSFSFVMYRSNEVFNILPGILTLKVRFVQNLHPQVKKVYPLDM